MTEGNKYTSEIHFKKKKHTMNLPATFLALFLFPSELCEGILFYMSLSGRSESSLIQMYHSA